MERRLPPVVARLWGREIPSRRGPRPGLELDTVVGAAVRLADRDGLEGVTMSSLASELGVATMSLYRYVGSKEELLVVMADAATPEPPPINGRAWRPYLTGWTRANRDFLLQRPWLLTLGQHAPPLGPRTLRWLDRALAALESTGLSHAEGINITTTLTGYASRQAALTHAMTATTGTVSEEVGGLVEYGEILGAVLDPAEFPALADAVRANAFGAAEVWIDDADFTFGLRLLLDGIEALIARKADDRPTSTAANP
ncbi:TetR/AcrR family transcriptional regulator [Micromonospora sp. WMMD710]|uniref:TetR/AcrR family transcriptional regulator n=1 Tax=Micromonospora sp. WMMD710 TaxID=3016085 RepID=UPI00241777AE|nr:TetR/AcrR family transcriptional regulator [Micromonospora sp. WMMD710]MDG4758597.1 TetR/AcrR family transcriptional regulator [Micromonospora sp. WMMD710]